MQDYCRGGVYAMVALSLFAAGLIGFNQLASGAQRPIVRVVSESTALKRAQKPVVNEGFLQVVGKEGQLGSLCPLKGTDVSADVAGFGARVTVKQTFTNPSKTPIEAVYTFPLPNDSAVDRMRFRIGGRVIEGVIKKREEARRIYEAAKNAGQATALLDQERPNIFTQSVANIMPGSQIEVEISYVQLLKYEDGWFEFNFPMVVGPRFLGNAPDPNKIAPPITPEGTRTGATIDLSVDIDAGTQIEEVQSVLHEIESSSKGANRLVVSLSKRDEIPNRDFILRYRATGDSVKSALLTTADPKRGGFFTLILLPPKAPTNDQIAPREMIFVMDQSGSQSGFPIEKSKELTKKLLQTMRPGDTFNVMGFSNTVNPLWAAPRPLSDENLAEAVRFVSSLQANGGTQLRLAIDAAMKVPSDPKRLRTILFKTDGYVGDEFGILDAIQKNRNTARVFTFGIGNSVNRFLIDNMAAEGRGDVEYVTLASDADAAVERFKQRLESPVLTDISVRFEGVQVADVLPSNIPDVFSEKPVILKGRYLKPGRGRVTITAKLGGEPWSQTLDMNLPAVDQSGSAIATLWAREMVDEIMRTDWMAQFRVQIDPQNVQNGGKAVTPTQQRITEIGLLYGIMTQFTSFVAVENRIINVGGKQVTVQVPVEMADGVSYEGIFGADKERGGDAFFRSRATGAVSKSSAGGGGGGYGGGGAGAAAGPPRTQGLLGASYGKTEEAAIRYISFDPSDNSIVTKAKDEDVVSLGKVLDAKSEEKFLVNLKPDQKERYLYLTRIDKRLRDAKPGKVEVQIWARDVSEELLRKLKEAGVTISLSDKSLKAVFGSCDAKALKALSQIQSVVKVLPLQS